MNEVTGTFPAGDSLELFYRAGLPESGSNGEAFVYQHGIGEHSGRYRPLTEALTAAGYTTFGLDSRGHGNSPGQRGDAPSIRALADDLEAFVRFVQTDHGFLRPHLFGHSMGGLIVLDFAEKDQGLIQSVISSGAGLKIRLTPSIRIKRTLGEPLAGLLPRLKMKTGLNPDALSHSREIIEAYKKDPLVHGFVSARLGLDLMDCGPGILKKISDIQIPAFFTHGELDTIALPEGTEDAAVRYCGERKECLRIYRGLKHETLNEIPEGRTQVISDILAFIKKAEKTG